ncbi:hypothetical protein D7Y15_39195 [Corallococcus sp. AB030]|nr:hypothetical protein D7V77_38105 [Corallococcus sp. CA041A]RKH99066.1 hypothetical protein D7Y15_39195 [Corallococcus sp. AB030]RUO87565.1 hypothetical protein D7Y11_39980 [Corallococcus sp. AB018]
MGDAVGEAVGDAVGVDGFAPVVPGFEKVGWATVFVVFGGAGGALGVLGKPALKLFMGGLRRGRTARGASILAHADASR